MTDVASSPDDAVETSTRSFSQAVKWSYVMDGGRQIMTTVISLLLAQALGPEAFGVAAMAFVYVFFIEMLQRQGLSSAIIQRKDLRKAHLDSAFWAVLGISLGLTGISILLAGWWAEASDLPQLRNVVIVLSFLVPVRGLVVVQDSYMRRSMDFKSLALRTNVAVLIAGVVAVVLAFAGAGVWALVTQQLVSATVGLALLWRLSPWRPSFQFSKSAFRELLGFSSLSFVSTIANFVGSRADALIIGLMFGPTAAGLYYFSSRLVNMVTDLGGKALQGAALPELSRHQSDPERFVKRLLTIVSSTALASIPLLALLAGGSDGIIDLLGKDEWGPASTVLRVLALSGVFRAVTMFIGPTLQALGRPGRLAQLSWLGALSSSLAFVVVGVLQQDASLTDQVVGLAISRAAVHGLFAAVYLEQIVRLLGVGWGQLFKAIGPAVLSSVAGFVAMVAIDPALSSIPLLVRLAIIGIVGATVMVLGLLRFDPLFQLAAKRVRQKIVAG